MFAQERINKDLSVSYGDDSGLYVEFKREVIQNKAKSEVAGRPIFDEFDYIHITSPGGKSKVIEKVNEGHKDRFPRHWQHYQEVLLGKTGGALIGTPLDQWPSLSLSQIHELRALHIHTVDQLAALNENGIAAIGIGGRELKAKAAAWLAQATENAEAEALAAENVRMAEKIEGLERTIAELSSAVQRMQATPARSVAPDPVPAYQSQQLEHSLAPEVQPSLHISMAHSDLSDLTEVNIPDRPRRGRPPKQG
jgi:hypothetical protein